MSHDSSSSSRSGDDDGDDKSECSHGTSRSGEHESSSSTSLADDDRNENDDNDAVSILYKDKGNEEEYTHITQQVQQWTRAIPIGLGLCPWAMKSQQHDQIRYRTTITMTTPEEVAHLLRFEAQRLCCRPQDDDNDWRTTLIVCPHIASWNDNDTTTGGFFTRFDEFVQQQRQALADNNNNEEAIPITLVTFHPHFLRWRGLPRGIRIGSTVQAHRRVPGGGLFSKSVYSFPATVVETHNPAFGLRKIKVRFHRTDNEPPQGGRRGRERNEQYVPMDWLVVDDDGLLGDPLPDNAMHRTPYPTIHLLRNEDLGRLTARDVSRVKRKNAHIMRKLGWEGIQRHVHSMAAGTTRTAAESKS